MRIFLVVAALLLAALIAPSAAPTKSDDIPRNVATLLDLLADPDVQAWLKKQREDKAAAPVAEPRAPSHWVADRIEDIRVNATRLVGVVPRLGRELSAAGAMFMDDLESSGRVGLAGLVALLAVAAVGSRLLYDRALKRVAAASPPAQGPVSRLAVRLAAELGRGLVVLVAASLAFVAFDVWPDVVERAALSFLTAYAVVLAVSALGRFLLVPAEAAPDYRLVPLDARRADYWRTAVNRMTALLAFGTAAVIALKMFGFSDDARELVSDILGLVVLIGALIVIHRAPEPVAPVAPLALVAGDAAEAEIGAATAPEKRRRVRWRAFASAFVVVLWLIWVFEVDPVFWLLAVIGALVPLLSVADLAATHALAEAAGGVDEPTSYKALVRPGLRFALMVVALLAVAFAWRVDLVGIATGTSAHAEMAQGVITALLILLVADFGWRVLRTLIDQRIVRLNQATLAGAPGDPSQGRLNTLLPIFRNFLMVTIAAMAVLMALAALGVEIGPLIAGAGIAGVAIGFGAQTLVRDIISGVFYLLDDAFRVGEYIESGSYKGTVESFSLRSVKLRHGRGAVYTVPFGVLGAIQNLSRDWAIDKLRLNIAYDTDFEQARKLIKKVGLELAEDPELKSLILEPLKMQGVEDFGDNGIKITLKYMCKPGQQSAVRRRAYVEIKKAFDENGIRFAANAGQPVPIPRPAA
jgi:small-conductance mechanosensitive channel